MKVLVTGANGYIGKAVLEELKKSNAVVIACDVQDMCVVEGVDYRHYNIFAEEKGAYESLDKPDVCIHLAWKSGFVHNASVHIDELHKHYRFLSSMFEKGCERVCALGTMHEVGWWNGEITAQTPCNPLSLYGIAKNALRQALLLDAQKQQWQFLWLRAFYIYGNDANGNSIFSKIMKAELEGKTEFPLNSGNNKYDFLALSELAEQIVAASLCNDAVGIVNVCSGNPKPLGQMVEEFIATNHLKIRPKYNVFPNRPYDSPAIWGNAEQIHEIIRKRDRHA